MSTLLNDTFTDTTGTALTAHTSDDAHTWAQVVGTGTPNAFISSTGTLYFGTTNNSAMFYSSLNIAYGQIIQIDFDFVIKTTIGGLLPAVYLLMTNQSTNKGYKLEQFSGTWYLQTGDAATTIFTTPGNTAPGTYHVTLKYDPGTQLFTLTVGGNTVTGTHSTYAPTVIALCNQSSGVSTDTTGQHYDNLTVATYVPALTVGATYAKPASSTSMRVTCAPGNGGVGALTYQFQRAPDSSGSPGAFANVGSASASTYLLDTGLTNGNIYWYRAVVTDTVPTSVTGANSGGVTAATPVPAGDVEFTINASTVVSLDAGAGANTPAKMYDGDFTTYYGAAAGTSGGWGGVDAGSGNKIVLTQLLLAPANSLNSDIAILGQPIQGSLISQTTVVNGLNQWTQEALIPTTPYLFTYALNSIPITPAGAFRSHRLYTPADIGWIGELHFHGWGQFTGTPVWKPCRPVFSPAAGRYAAGQTVSMTSATTDALIYYTVDGTTPTVTAGVPQGTTTLYSGPISLPTISTGTIYTVKAISYHATSATPSSDVVSAPFNPPEFVPDTGLNTYSTVSTNPQDWYDDTGYLLECHNSHIFYDVGTSKYWRTGLFCSTPSSSGDCPPRGIWFYTSTDLYNWHREGMLLPPPPNIAAWQDGGHYLDSQTRNTILRNPSPIDPNKKYVMYVHMDVQSTGYENGWTGVATAPAMAGPWTWLGKFRCTVAGVTKQSADSYAFLDTDGQAYFTNALRDLTTGLNQQIYLQKLDPSTDWTTPLGDATAFGSAGREACVLFKYPYTSSGTYFLLSSLGYPYGANTQTGVAYRASTTLAGMSSQTDVTIWATPPVSTAANYFTQPSWAFTPQGKKGVYFIFDWWDPGGSPLSMYNSRYAAYPVPPSAFPTATTLSLPVPTTWNLSALPNSATNHFHPSFFSNAPLAGVA